MLHIVWVQVSAGVAHSLFVGQAGQLWGCGSNAELQLSQEQSMSSAPTPLRLLPAAAGRPVRFAVAAGSHSLAVLEEWPHTNGQLRHSIGGQPLASSGSCQIHLGRKIFMRTTASCSGMRRMGAHGYSAVYNSA